MKTIQEIIHELVCDLELEQESPTHITQDIAYVTRSSICVQEHEDYILISQLETYGIMEQGDNVASARIPRYEVHKETLKITEL